MNRLKWVSALGGAVLALGLAGAQSAQAAVIFNQQYPVGGGPSDYVLNCVGQPVAFQGVCHTLVVQTVDNAGGVHYDVHDDCHVDLVNLVTGETGVGNQSDQSHFNTELGQPYEETDTLQLLGIFPGSGNNFGMKALFHITVDANGNVTSSVDNFTTECR